MHFDAAAHYGAKFHCRLSDLVQGRIFAFGIWEPNLTRFIEKRMRPGDTFVDVGANIGYFSLLAASLVGPKGKVVSIEASPSIFEMLNDHLRFNHVRNVHTINAAAAAGPGTLSLYRGPDDNLGRTSLLASRGLSLEATVVADRLSTLAGDDLRRARLIKIDVEGAEPPILLDLLSVADSLRRDVEIVVEITPEDMQQFGITTAEIFERYKAAGFNAYLLENSYLDGAYVERHVPQPPAQAFFCSNRADGCGLQPDRRCRTLTCGFWLSDCHFGRRTYAAKFPQEIVAYRRAGGDEKSISGKKPIRQCNGFVFRVAARDKMRQ